MRTTLALALTLALAAAALAQEAPKPPKELALLKAMEGTWDTAMNFGGMESKGTVTYKMDIGGMWLSGSMESELFGAKFTGKSFESYDEAKKKYVSVWMDSMSNSPVVQEGTYDAEKKTLTLAGEGPGEDRKTSKYKSVTEFKEADTFVMTMYMGDAKEPGFTVTYKRKKK